ncbi:hypothetical protein M9Y10_031370 [Tritrichomonas musculus]|uniref:Uncharacterized protein n=2 Tax=Tritrichomonas musculus TaxID=1915356 RepID=A0ABR2GK68_9EUKA
MFPNQIPNQINQQNDGNKPPNMGNIGNMGGMPYYPYHFMNQQFQNQMPPNIKQNQPQRSKKEPRKKASIVQVQSTPLNQPMPNPLFPPPPPAQMQSQATELNVNVDYPMKLMNISDDRLDFFCQLFDIPLRGSRQGIINYFMSTTINRLCQNSSKLLNMFFEHFTNINDNLLHLREPKIPRIFNIAVGLRSRYILLQFYQGAPFEFVHLNISPTGTICVGQFVCDGSNIPFGTVKVNESEIKPVNFGEIGQFFLLGPAETINHVSFQLNSTLIDHFYIWFVIQYLIPNHSFAQKFIIERAINAEVDDQNLVRSTICKGCPPFSLSNAIESAFHTGYICCPICNQKITFDQIKIEYITPPGAILSNNNNANSNPNNSNGAMNGFSNLLIGPQNTQISRFNSANSMGMIPMTPPQIGTPQQMQIQQQQPKKSRPKKLTPKTNSTPQPPLPMQMQMQMNMNNMNSINSMNNISSMNGINNISNMSNMNNMNGMNNMNNMPVMKNIHSMNNMMPMKSMGMSNMMNMNVNMNVGMRNPVQMNPPMSMGMMNQPEIKNKPLLSSPPQNSNPIPLVQSGLNPMAPQILNPINSQQPPSQSLPQPQPVPVPASIPSSIHQQNQIPNVTTQTPNQQLPPPQPPQPSQPPQPPLQQDQQPQQQPSKPPKQPKQAKPRKSKNLSQQDENDPQKNAANKNLTKQTKQKQKAKAQSQPPLKADSTSNTPKSGQLIHTSSTPQFIEKQAKPLPIQPPENTEEEEEVIPVDTPEMKKAKTNLNSFLCMSLKCGKNELNWKECVYEKDSELKINDENFHIDEYQNVDDYLDYVDSFM